MFNTNTHRRPHNELLIGSILLLALLLTRSGITRSHFGTEFSLPDASWAVFWLMGLLTARAVWPMLLLIACVVVDYLVVSAGGSASCMTPAYPFLIPAYLSLWAMGRWSRQQLPIRVQTLPLLCGSILLGASICFLITNVSFYLLSGYFTNMTFMQYAPAVIRYWPHYLLHTAIYAGTGLLIHYIATHRHSASTARKQAQH